MVADSVRCALDPLIIAVVPFVILFFSSQTRDDKALKAHYAGNTSVLFGAGFYLRVRWVAFRMIHNITTMNLKTRLDSESRCDYWKSLAAQASFEPSRLAEMAEISLRQLERYFARDFTATPKAWLREQRMQAACSLLSKAHSVKDAAYTLHFKHSSHFCREFKRHYGMTPSQFVRASAIPCSILYDRPLDSG